MILTQEFYLASLFKANYEVGGIYSFYIASGELTSAKCGKGYLLRRVERFERAIGRVHGRRLLLRWLAKRAGKQQKYNPKKRFVNEDAGQSTGQS
jgi:hypothetical protein